MNLEEIRDDIAGILNIKLSNYMSLFFDRKLNLPVMYNPINFRPTTHVRLERILYSLDDLRVLESDSSETMFNTSKIIEPF